MRRAASAPRPAECEDATFAGEGVTLKGWRCAAATDRRGTLIYLHGIADNRGSARGVIERFTRRGFDVIAYDSRAHGESQGESCTYGFWEKEDLRRVLDALPPGPIVLLGTSLGAAVALQEAAVDPRVSALVGAETFADLRTVAAERAPFFFTSGVIRQAFARAEQAGGFRVDDVSPVEAAARITAPVLLVHGEDDRDTPPEHSRRVYAALAGPRRLLLVPGAHHNESLQGPVWDDVQSWIESAITPRGAAH
jgi:pimeloyl-ACP methyl ester carboxylesterase